MRASGCSYPFLSLAHLPICVVSASALDEHDDDNTETPIRYTHMDIGGAVATGPPTSGRDTGRPVTTLVARHIFSQ